MDDHNPNKTAVIVTSKMPKDDQSLRVQKIALKKQKITLFCDNSPLRKNLSDL